MATTEPKRRILRFSIRTLLIVLTIFCVWLSWKVERARKQREVVAWVQEMGGSVHYGYELYDNTVFLPNAKPPGPEWLRNLLGIDYFGDVRCVFLDGSEVSDVSPLAELTNLEVLHLTDTSVSDVTPLFGLTSLEVLNLYRTRQ